jgi:CO/xanthine dehydrogenase Mo-binding subunit
MRTSHLRAPQGPQVHFASESFIEELAAAQGTDAAEFRLKHLTNEREIAVVKAAVERSGWQSRPGPNPNPGTGEVVTGRGMGLESGYGSYVAVVVEAEVNKTTGRVWPRRITVAHDNGFTFNPAGLKNTIEGCVLQGTSRALWEEVAFDRNKVNSIDWFSYPILEATEAPEEINLALIDRPNEAPGGAGEPALVPLMAAIGNAIFDATGVRIRRVPFRPDAVKEALVKGV